MPLPCSSFGEDLLPLLLLFAISVTGLMLTASYTWMKGYAYDFLAILHAITVIFTLLWLPFGKFFHIFQRSAHVGVGFYKDVGRQGEQARCRRCGAGVRLADARRGPDRGSERQLGYRYEMAGDAEHYQWICPSCRRVAGRAWRRGSCGKKHAAEPDVTRNGKPTLARHPDVDAASLAQCVRENEATWPRYRRLND